MKKLRDAFEGFETQRKRLEVHTQKKAVAEQIARQVTTRNLEVVHEKTSLPSRDGYIVIRTADDEFLGTVGLSQFRTLFSPDIKQVGASRSEQFGELLELLDQTVFKLPERRSLLAVSREIEDRAWRCNDGVLYAGFQRTSAFETQKPLYQRLHRERELSVHVFVEDHWNTSAESLVVRTDAEDEIGRFWFVLYDGGDDPMQASGLIAEEKKPDTYYGFWTYDPVLITNVIEYLDVTYCKGWK